MSGPAERRVSTAVPLGDRQRRSDDADGSVYVSPVGPPLLVAVVRRMCRAVSTSHLSVPAPASLSVVSMQVSERERTDARRRPGQPGADAYRTRSWLASSTVHVVGRSPRRPEAPRPPYFFGKKMLYAVVLDDSDLDHSPPLTSPKISLRELPE